MKKSLFFATLLICIFSLTFFAQAEDAVVFADGTTYTTLAEAAAALPDTGGTIVVTGAVVHSNDVAVTLPAKPITVTSVYGGTDYAATNGAYFGIGRTLNLGADATFENITIKQTNTTTTYGNIYANGHHLTIGEGVTTVANETTGVMTPIHGGSASGALSSDTHITVHSGAWDVIHGGSYVTLKGNSVVDIYGGTIGTVYGGSRSYNHAGTATINIYGGTIGTVYGGSRGCQFNGDVTINMTGGTITGALVGGNGPSGKNFTGDTTLNISGGTIEYSADGAGVVGGSVGASGGTAYTFTGNIAINISGNAQVYPLVLGASRYNNIATTGDIAVDISGNAKLYRHVYGGGYGAKVTTVEKGIVVTVRDNASFTAPANNVTHLCGGANSGTVTGNVTVNVCDNVYVPGHVYGAGYFGSVTGTSTVNIIGGTVTGKVSAGAVQTGTVGTGAITLAGGTLGNVLETAAIDLSAGGTLSVGGSVTASGLVGGGKLILPAAATLTADTFSGEVALELVGTPVSGQAYITVNDAASTGTVTYAPIEDEVLVRTATDSAVTFTIDYPNRYETTHVTITYYNPNGEDAPQPDIVVYRGNYTASDREKLIDVTDGTPVEIDLAPGLYYYKVYYDGGTDYHVKHFYLDGKSASLSFDVPWAPYVENSYAEPRTIHTTDQVLKNFFGTDGLVGYTLLDTPTFTKYTDDKTFMSNADLLEYVDALAENCEYLYLFKAELADEENLMPILVFTKDTIAADATIEEIAAAVRAKGVREILMISGGIHGNEPAGEEGVLNFAKSLAGEYGEEILDHFGAIAVIPAASPDNLMRFTRTFPDDVNPNRDFTSLSHGNTQMIAYLCHRFMPTVYIDCHEDNSGTIGFDSADSSHALMDDVCFTCSGVANAPLSDMNGVIAGTNPVLKQEMYLMLSDMIERANASGLRGGYYQWPYYSCGQSHSYAMQRGAYGFLVEVMRIWSGKSHYARAVYAMEVGIKAVVAEIVERNGAMAQDVAEARAAAAVKTFDPENYFVTKMALGESGLTLSSAHPSVYVDGTYKDENAVSSYKRYDTPTAYRPMATGFVLDAGAANIDGVLAKLDQHGLEYTKIKAGSTLTLRKYTMGDTVTYAEAAAVTFANGAYAVHTDTSDAYLIGYLFEPDSYTSSDTLASLYQMGLIAEADALYRSETDGFAETIAALADIVGDADGNGNVDVADVLTVLKALIGNIEIVNADMNSDGKITLVDVLHLLKTIVQ